VPVLPSPVDPMTLRGDCPLRTRMSNAGLAVGRGRRPVERALRHRHPADEGRDRDHPCNHEFNRIQASLPSRGEPPTHAMLTPAVDLHVSSRWPKEDRPGSFIQRPVEATRRSATARPGPRAHPRGRRWLEYSVAEAGTFGQARHLECLPRSVLYCSSQALSWSAPPRARRRSARPRERVELLAGQLLDPRDRRHTKTATARRRAAQEGHDERPHGVLGDNLTSLRKSL
jgi:hypothetical protein